MAWARLPFGRPTPDGYPLTELAWASSGQMSRRFEIARAIGSGSAGLFDPEDGGAAAAGGFPQLSNRLYFEAVEPFLDARTRVGAAAREFAAGVEHLSAVIARSSTMSEAALKQARAARPTRRSRHESP